MHHDKFITIKNQLHALISQIYFWNETPRVSDSSSVHHQEFFTVHIALVYVIQVCRQLSLAAVSKPVWHIPLLCVQWKTPDDGQGNCPKHVEFRSKNKFLKSVHVVGFLLKEIYSHTFHRNLSSLLQVGKYRLSNRLLTLWPICAAKD